MSPSKLLLSVEVIRAMIEYGVGWVATIPLHSVVSKGDGHPVMVLPGLGGSDGSTHYIRHFLYELGYDAHPWGLGRNIGPRYGAEALLSKIRDRVEVLYEQSGNKPVSLVGWSLGGIYAREVAKLIPDKVRQVITLGTPFKSANDNTSASAAMLYRILSRDTSHKDPATLAQIGLAPPVPFTSIYSKTDGVVHWESSIEIEGPTSENIEILLASHMGLGHNPLAMYIISDRLTYTKDNWIPFSW